MQCLRCGKCCHFENGKPCPHLIFEKGITRCRIYKTRLGTRIGNNVCTMRANTKYDYEGCPYNTSKPIKKMNIDNRWTFLLQVKEILDKAGIEFWIDFGTLLGFYRQGDFLETDPDIDLGVKRENQDKVIAVAPELAKLGKLITRVEVGNYLAGYKLYRDDFWIDIAFFFKHEDKYILPISEWPKVMVFNSKFYDNLVDLEVKGEKFKMPKDIEEYMILHYGEDWRRPFKEGEDYDLHQRPNIEPIQKYIQCLKS